MIVGEDWLWLHMPKTAGKATEAALRALFPDAAFDEYDRTNVIWHESVGKRAERVPGFDPGGRRIICGIRRLPHWVLSRVHFEATRASEPYSIPREMLLAGQIRQHTGFVLTPDFVLSRFVDHPVAHWLRTEHLADDLAAALRLPAADVAAKLDRRNQTRIAYIRDTAFWFTSAELEELYARNPLWASVETQAYGDVLR